MEYSALLKHSYQRTIRYRSMWWLGMFVVAGSSGSQFVSNFTSGISDIVDTADGSNAYWAFEYFLSEFWWVLLIIFGVIFLVWLLFILFNILASIGMLHGAKAARQQQAMSFLAMVQAALPSFWPVFGLHCGLFFIAFVALLILAVPIIALALTGIGLIIVIPVIFGLVLLMIPVSAVVGIWYMYVIQYIALQQQSLIESVVLGWKLFRTHVGDSLVVYFILLLVNIGFMIPTLIVMVIIGVPFGLLAVAAYFANSWAIVAGVVGIGALILFAALLILKGVRNAFMFHSWHELFAELT